MIEFLKITHRSINLLSLLKRAILIEHDAFLKFMFSKKAAKIDEIFTVNLTLCSKCQINGEDFINFCDLLRKDKLYK